MAFPQLGARDIKVGVEKIKLGSTGVEYCGGQLRQGVLGNGQEDVYKYYYDDEAKG